MSNPYLRKWRDGVQHYVHRLVWIDANGPIPKGLMIDHINRDKHDNRLENLRLVTRSQNAQNRKNVTGYTQISGGRYQAQIMLDYKHYFLGHFDTEAEARSAYLKAKKEYHL